jgi:hypothetical protein
MNLLVAEVGRRAHPHLILLERFPHQRRGQVNVPCLGSPARRSTRVPSFPDADAWEPA